METSHHEGCFVICEDALEKACDISLNAGIAYAVIAAGTDRHHVQSTWSAQAVAKYSGMNWRRASEAISALRAAKIITKTRGTKSRPRHHLRKPRKMIWIPTTLVVSANGETPPISRIRQTQQPDILQVGMKIYGAQNLIENGGLPPNMILHRYQPKTLMTWREFNVLGFRKDDRPSCLKGAGPIPASNPWPTIGPLFRVGLLEWVPHLAEGPEGELIHALNGDKLANEISHELAVFGDMVRDRTQQGDNCDWIIPVPRHIINATVIGIARTRYRPPKTRMTRAWWSQHEATMRFFRDTYRAQNRAMTRLAA